MKKGLIALSTLLLTSWFAPQAFALEVQVQPDGSVYFYQGEVLGMNQNHQETTSSIRPSKIIPENSGKDIIIRPQAKNVEVSVGKRYADVENNVEEMDQMRETMTTEQFRMQFPSAPEMVDNPETQRGIRPTEDQLNQVNDQIQNQAEDSYQTQINNQQQLQDQTKTRNQEREADLSQQEEYIKQLRQQRQQRLDETVEIQAVPKATARIIRITSRGIAAQVKSEGAQVSFDPDTNEVLLVNPEGTTSVINHLPDQAVERMTALGALDQLPDTVADVSISISDDGTVKYTLPDYQDKKLFGLFKRKVPTTVVLDDTTGMVDEIQQQSPTYLSQLLDMFSF